MISALRLASQSFFGIQPHPHHRLRKSFLTVWITVGLIAHASADESLQGLIRESLTHHPSLTSAQAQYESAKHGAAGASWQFWPTPSVGVDRADAGKGDVSYRGSKQVITMRLQQPLWTGGRLTANLNKAEARALISRADLEIARQQLALRVIQAWSEALTAHTTAIAYEQNVAIHNRLFQLVERRTKDGASAQADIELARSRLAAAKADLSGAVSRREIAIEKLRLLIGRRPNPETLSPTKAETASLSNSDALINAARAQSPALLKAQAQATAAEAEVAIARSSLSPEVALRAERQYGNFSYPDAGPANRVFVSVSTALGGGLSTISAIDAATSQYRAAVEDIATQALAIDEQVFSDFNLYRTAVDRKLSLTLSRQSANNVSASWERQFLAGLKQWQDLMNSARELAQTDAQLADAVGAEQLSAWRLKILTEGVDAVIRTP